MATNRKKSLRCNVKNTKENSSLDDLKKRLIEAALHGEIQPLLSLILEHDVEFHNLVKETLHRPFNEWTFSMALEHFNQSPPIEGGFEPPSYVVPDSAVAYISESILFILQARGGTLVGANEATRCKVIDVFLNRIIGDLGLFEILDEGPLSGDIASGYVEYVLRSYGKIVGLVLEAKKDRDQGLAQLFLEMHTALQMNKARGFPQQEFIGILSTGEDWWIICYRRGSTDPFVLSRRFTLDITNPRPIANLVYGLQAIMVDKESATIADPVPIESDAITTEIASLFEAPLFLVLEDMDTLVVQLDTHITECLAIIRQLKDCDATQSLEHFTTFKKLISQVRETIRKLDRHVADVV